VNNSELREHLARYSRLRSTLGTPLGSSLGLLERFVGYLGEDLERITTQQVFDWLDTTLSVRSSSLNRSRHLGAVRQFLEYLSAAVADVQVPALGLVTGYRRPVPCILTPEEIRQILAEGAVARPGDFSSVVLQTALGLLACTGLRAGEAIALDRTDVSPRESPGVLLIREAKFGKSRVVPLHPSAQRQLSSYASQRELLGYGAGTAAFFVSSQGGRLAYGALSAGFRTIVRRLDLKPRNGSGLPTLHSLRHTFVMTRLRCWHDDGIDVKTRFEHLATYLGHIDFRETFWYVSATPELLIAATSSFAAPASAGA
jgi:integrase/recombinase XerD